MRGSGCSRQRDWPEINQKRDELSGVHTQLLASMDARPISKARLSIAAARGTPRAAVNETMEADRTTVKEVFDLAPRKALAYLGITQRHCTISLSQFKRYLALSAMLEVARGCGRNGHWLVALYGGHRARHGAGLHRVVGSRPQPLSID